MTKKPDLTLRPATVAEALGEPRPGLAADVRRRQRKERKVENRARFRLRQQLRASIARRMRELIRLGEWPPNPVRRLRLDTWTPRTPQEWATLWRAVDQMRFGDDDTPPLWPEAARDVTALTRRDLIKVGLYYEDRRGEYSWSNLQSIPHERMALIKEILLGFPSPSFIRFKSAIPGEFEWRNATPDVPAPPMLPSLLGPPTYDGPPTVKLTLLVYDTPPDGEGNADG